MNSTTPPTNERELIEEIVRQVMARLDGARGVSGGESAAKKLAAAPELNGQPVGGELRLTDRVISVALVKDRLQNVRSLVISPKALVTPAVRDLLRERQITLHNGASSNTTAAKASSQKAVFVAADGGEGSLQQLGDLLNNEGMVVHRACERELAAGLAAAVAAVRKRNMPVVFVTSQPLVAACLANRQRGLRAAAVASSAALQAAMDTLGVNLLVIAADRNAADTAALVGQLVAAGVQRVPTNLARLLD